MNEPHPHKTKKSLVELSSRGAEAKVGLWPRREAALPWSAMAGEMEPAKRTVPVTASECLPRGDEEQPEEPSPCPLKRTVPWFYLVEYAHGDYCSSGE